MGTREVGLLDISQGAPPSRARLLAPLRYLFISHPEKTLYDFVIPLGITAMGWVAYMLIYPKPPLFGDEGLIRFVRDLLVMGVLFMVGSLAAVAMGAPGDYLNRRPRGAPLYLDGRSLTMRAFVCYLLGYVAFLGLVTLGFVVAASLLHNTIVVWTSESPALQSLVKSIGALALSALLSFLAVAVFWSLYFLTHVVNQEG